MTFDYYVHVRLNWISHIATVVILKLTDDYFRIMIQIINERCLRNTNVYKFINILQLCYQHPVFSHLFEHTAFFHTKISNVLLVCKRSKYYRL